MADGFTERSRLVLSLARKHAERQGCAAIGADHVLLGFMGCGGGVALKVLGSLGITLDEIRSVDTGDTQGRPSRLGIPLAPETKQAIEHAAAWAEQLDHGAIGTEHLLLGLLSAKGTAHQLRSCGIDLDLAKLTTLEVLGVDALDSIPATCGCPLEQLVDRASITRGARDHLLRGESLVLVGPRGVGKTSLARLIAAPVAKLTHVGLLDGTIITPMTAGTNAPLPPETTWVGFAARQIRDRHHPVILEFSDDGLDILRRDAPETAARFYEVRVAIPDKTEAMELILAAQPTFAQAAVTTSLDVIDATLTMSSRIAYPLPPWSSIQALRLAVEIECDDAVPGFRALKERIVAFGREKEAAIRDGEFERAAWARDQARVLASERDALLSKAPPAQTVRPLSMSSVVLAIDRLAANTAWADESRPGSAISSA